MTMNNIQSFAPTSSYLSTRFEAAKKEAEPTRNSSANSFSQALEATASSAAPTPPIILSETIPYSSFIDNLDLTKFKSDPLHFGKFIPIEAEVPSTANEATGTAGTEKEIQSSDAGLDGLLASIEAQLNYTNPAVIEPSVPTTVEPHQTQDVTSDAATLAGKVMESAIVEESAAAEQQNPPSTDLTSQYLASNFSAQTSNADDLFAQALTDERDPHAED